MVNRLQLRTQRDTRLWPRITTLIADPPWPFSDRLPPVKSTSRARGAKGTYKSTMSVREIMDYPLPPLADDCRLFLWRVASMQEEALDVLWAWGFQLKSEIVWVKERPSGNLAFGMGRTVRGAHETCLIAVR